MRVLLEMRAALDGHAGIPQATRLLFRSLRQLPGVEVQGLLQSGNLVLEPGLPMRDGELLPLTDALDRIDRLSKVVVSLQQGPASHRLEHLRKRLLKLGGPLWAALRALLGLREPLTGFDPAQFQDYVWRAMFARSLPASDLPAVTGGLFRVLRWPWSLVNAVGVGSGALGWALYPRLDTQGIDVMIAETPYPGRVRHGTTLVVRYHDAIPLLMPHTIKDRGYHRSQHLLALQRNARDGAWFACVSEATRRDLLSVLPGAEARCVTIPNMLSHHYHPESADASRVPEIIWSRKNRHAPHHGGVDMGEAERQRAGQPYLLMVSTLEPRKNTLALLEAWELLRANGHGQLHLVCVGSLGWHHGAILARLTPWLGRGGVHLLEDVPADDLRLLYRHAALTVCPSAAEGFDFSGVEAMASGGLVAASDIPVHREIYQDASAYFNPYSSADMASVMAALLVPEAGARHEALRAAGQRVAEGYRPEVVLPQWSALLERLVGRAGTLRV